MARAKNGLFRDVIQSASTGRRGSDLVTFGSSAARNLAGTILAPSGRPPPFLPPLKPPGVSVTEIGVPFLAACCGVALMRVFMKNAAMPQYSVCFQSVKGWLWHWAHCSCTPRNIRETLPVILSTLLLATK